MSFSHITLYQILNFQKKKQNQQLLKIKPSTICILLLLSPVNFLMFLFSSIERVL